MASQEVQHKNFCFTYNYGGEGQPSKSNVDVWWEAVQTLATYGVAGWEVAPTSGQLHLQGYVQFEKKTRITALKKIPCGVTVHWAVAVADEQDNYDYCTKDGNAMEFGEATEVNPGKREKKRWKIALDLAKKGTYDDIDPQIQVQFMRNLDYIRDKYQDLAADLPPGTRHLWIWGPTRSGKSRRARAIFSERFPQTRFYSKLHNKWWDHYEPGQPALMDDLGLDVGRILGGYLKQWMDIYAFKVEYKGGAKDIRPPLLIVTSNYHPWDLFHDDVTGLYEPIMQRLEVVYLGSTPEETPPPKGPSQLVLPQTGTQSVHGGPETPIGVAAANGTGPFTPVPETPMNSPTTPATVPIAVPSVLRVIDLRDVIDLTDD